MRFKMAKYTYVKADIIKKGKRSGRKRKYDAAFQKILGKI